MRTLKIPNIRSHVHHCYDTQNYHTHQQEWVALLVRLLCQVKRPEFPAKDKEGLKSTHTNRRKNKTENKTTTQNKQTTLLLCFLYLFVELMITINEYDFV